MADRQVTLVLNARPDLSAGQTALRNLGAAAGEAAAKQKDLQAQFDKSMQAARGRAEFTGVSAQPGNVREQVEVTLQQAAAQEHLNAALEYERELQTGVTAIQERLNATYAAGIDRLQLLQAALDPVEVARRVEQTIALKNAEEELNAALEAGLAARTAQPVIEGVPLEQALREEVALTIRLEEEQRQLNELKAAERELQTGKTALAEQVEGILAAEDAQKRLNAALKEARGEEEKPKPTKEPGRSGVFGAVGGALGGRLGGLLQSAEGIIGQYDRVKGAFDKIGAKASAGEGAGAEGTGGAGAGGGIGIGGVAVAVVGIGIALKAASVAVETFTGVIRQGAQLASPVTFQRLNVAIEDTIATIGGRFVPVFETLIGFTRDVGDAFATILPSTGEVKSLMGELSAALKPMKDAFYDIAPLLKQLFTDAIRGTAATIKWFGDYVIKPAAAQLKSFADFLGFAPVEKKSSAGAAVRDVKVVSDLESVFTDAARAGLMSGIGPDENAITVQSLESVLDRFSDKLRDKLGDRTYSILKAVMDAFDPLKGHRPWDH